MIILILNLIMAVVYLTYAPKHYLNPIFDVIFLISVVNTVYIAKLLIDLKMLKEQSNMEFLRASKAGQISIIDPLTGIYNRRHFDDMFNRIYNEAKNSNMYFSLMIIDIDHFKKFNDTYGHDVGDKVLKAVVNKIKSNIRKNLDMFFRFGGEEFIILTSDSKDGAVRLAKKLNQLEYKEVEKITISIGVSSYHKGMSKDELIKIADNNLYKAKENGRNQVVYDENN